MTSKISRRDILLAGGKLTLASLTLGSLSLLPTSIAKAGGAMNITGFGWKLTPLLADGGNAIFKIAIPLTIKFLTMDVSFALVSPIGPPNVPVEVLFQAIAGSPGFGISGPTFSVNTGPDPNISFSGTAKDPSLSYTPVPTIAPTFMRNVLTAVALKVETVSGGIDGATGRNVTVNPDLSLNAGDALIFHIEHQGSTRAQAEMQVVIGYV